MNIETFKNNYNHLRDIDYIFVDDLCDHPQHIRQGENIKKGPAKRNILKHGGKEFICRNCYMKYDNPMNHVGENRQSDEEIVVFCPCSDHQDDPARIMRKTSYYGEMKEPYLQICKSCAQLGKTISEDQREKIRLALTGIKKSDEFKENLSKYMKTNPEGIARGTKNLLDNHCVNGMLGKSHSEETKQKMSETHSGKKFPEEHRQNISEGRKKMLAETGGFTKEHREKLSQAARRNYEKGFDPNKYHRRGWHDSPKAGRVFYRSSYEKKAYLKLDADDEIKYYEVESIKINFFNPEKKINGTYLVDIKAKKIDGSSVLIEVKPQMWLKDKTVIAKHDAAINYCKKEGAEFEVWSEVELFGPVYDSRKIRTFNETLDSEERIQIKKEMDRNKAKKYYSTNIAQDTVEVYCEYCKELHNPLRLTYDKNIERNGKYICERYGGHLAGSKPKKKKENPHAVDGKKQCNECQDIKLFECFGIDGTKSDGYSTRCKTCRAKVAKTKYQSLK